MYNTKMSMLEVMKVADHVFSCGYCDLWHTLHFTTRDGYNSGVYGWNNDIYFIRVYGEVVAITTGYRNTRGYRIPGELLKKYEALAIENSSITDYASYNAAMHKNLAKLAIDLINMKNGGMEK